MDNLAITLTIVDKIRCSKDIKTIFKIATQEIRLALKSDRLIVYQYNPNCTGKVIAESVDSGWVSLLKEQSHDEVLQRSFIQLDRDTLRDWSQGEQGDVIEADHFLEQTEGRRYTSRQKFTAVDDIYAKEFPECYLQSLEKYQAKAYLLVPIFQEGKLWGLLGAYQNSNTRVWQDSEIDLMLLISNQLAIALQQLKYINELKQQSEKQQKQSETLKKALIELKKTQKQLIHQEKLAALGQLVAGIAHEINTPLGAIQAAAGDNTKALIEAIAELPKLSEYLSQEEKDIFFNLLDLAITIKPVLSSSEKRHLKRQLLPQLKEQNIDNARSVGDVLIDIGITNKIDFCLPLLKHPKVDWILDLAYNLTCLMQNNKNILISIEKAAKVVFALKSYARFDHSGQKKLVQVQDGLETVLEIYWNRLKYNIEVFRDYQNIPDIWCYPDELIQVWTNLIHNSIQAMNEGGTLMITTSLENEQIKVEIHDSGSGIPLNIRDKIFQAFFTTKPTGEGSGLGLHISKKIIDKHHGNIAVKSSLGHTKFSILLPIGNQQSTDIKQLSISN